MVRLKACRKLTDDEKYNLMKYHFVPARNYKFPSRSFNGNPRFFKYIGYPNLMALFILNLKVVVIASNVYYLVNVVLQ